MTSSIKPGISDLLKPLERTASDGGVEAVSNDYLTYYDQSSSEIEARRKQEAMAVNNAYYDLATDFYEYGWGESFHFAALRPGESREHSMAKHEYYLALKMQLKKGQRVLVRYMAYLSYVVPWQSTQITFLVAITVCSPVYLLTCNCGGSTSNVSLMMVSFVVTGTELRRQICQLMSQLIRLDLLQFTWARRTSHENL
jgi:hypothetical protein